MTQANITKGPSDMGPFFATLNHPNGGIVPLVQSDEHGNESVATFDSFKAAKQAIHGNLLGAAYGGRVYNSDDDGEDV